MPVKEADWTPVIFALENTTGYPQSISSNSEPLIFDHTNFAICIIDNGLPSFFFTFPSYIFLDKVQVVGWSEETKQLLGIPKQH